MPNVGQQYEIADWHSGSDYNDGFPATLLERLL